MTFPEQCKCGASRKMISERRAYYECGTMVHEGSEITLANHAAPPQVETPPSSEDVQEGIIKWVEGPTGPRGVVVLNGVFYDIHLTRSDSVTA